MSSRKLRPRNRNANLSMDDYYNHCLERFTHDDSDSDSASHSDSVSILVPDLDSPEEVVEEADEEVPQAQTILASNMDVQPAAALDQSTPLTELDDEDTESVSEVQPDRSWKYMLENAIKTVEVRLGANLIANDYLKKRYGDKLLALKCEFTIPESSLCYAQSVKDLTYVIRITTSKAQQSPAAHLKHQADSKMANQSDTEANTEANTEADTEADTEAGDQVTAPAKVESEESGGLIKREFADISAEHLLSLFVRACPDGPDTSLNKSKEGAVIDTGRKHATVFSRDGVVEEPTPITSNVIVKKVIDLPDTLPMVFSELLRWSNYDSIGPPHLEDTHKAWEQYYSPIFPEDVAIGIADFGYRHNLKHFHDLAINMLHEVVTDRLWYPGTTAKSLAQMIAARYGQDCKVYQFLVMHWAHGDIQVKEIDPDAGALLGNAYGKVYWEIMSSSANGRKTAKSVRKYEPLPKNLYYM